MGLLFVFTKKSKCLSRTEATRNVHHKKKAILGLKNLYFTSPTGLATVGALYAR